MVMMMMMIGLGSQRRRTWVGWLGHGLGSQRRRTLRIQLGLGSQRRRTASHSIFVGWLGHGSGIKALDTSGLLGLMTLDPEDVVLSSAK